MTENSPIAFLLKLSFILTLALNVDNAFYNFESTKKAIKYYEIFLLENKKSQPIQFLRHNFTLFPISFLFFETGLLELASKM